MDVYEDAECDGGMENCSRSKAYGLWYRHMVVYEPKVPAFNNKKIVISMLFPSSHDSEHDVLSCYASEIPNKATKCPTAVEILIWSGSCP